MMGEAAKNFLLSMWLQCRLTEQQVELAFQLGRITEQERDEILNTPRHCDG
ncbi:hypothetical protein [Thermobacillus sp.]|uniref:hypothetical protein n=1 Tax=Thermobacillus sp. TaxID=2108467 RepID=UPI00258002B1|nr:hypothetical protein [Thermobacillus sp.]